MIWFVEFISPFHTTSLFRVSPHARAYPTTLGADARKSSCCWSLISKKKSISGCKASEVHLPLSSGFRKAMKMRGKKYCPKALSAVTREGLLMIWQVLEELIDLMQVSSQLRLQSSPETSTGWWRSLKEFSSKRNQPEQLFNLGGKKKNR